MQQPSSEICFCLCCKTPWLEFNDRRRSITHLPDGRQIDSRSSSRADRQEIGTWSECSQAIFTSSPTPTSSFYFLHFVIDLIRINFQCQVPPGGLPAQVPPVGLVIYRSRFTRKCHFQWIFFQSRDIPSANKAQDVVTWCPLDQWRSVEWKEWNLVDWNVEMWSLKERENQKNPRLKEWAECSGRRGEIGDVVSVNGHDRQPYHSGRGEIQFSLLFFFKKKNWFLLKSINPLLRWTGVTWPCLARHWPFSYHVISKIKTYIFIK